MRIVLAGTVLVTAFWSSALLGRAPNWMPGLRTLIVIGGIVAAIGIVGGQQLGTKFVAGSAIVGAVVALTGPTAWALNTVSTPHSGSIVTAGPAVEGARFGGPGGGRGPGAGGFPGFGGAGGGTFPGGAGGQGGFPGGGRNGTGGAGGFPGGGAGGAGGLLNGSTPTDEVVAVLTENADQYTWVAAAVGSNEASGYQLATEQAVMPIGGFNGSDPSPTLERFQQ